MVTYEYDAARGLLIATVSGVVRPEEFHDGFPDIPPGTLELLDMTEATGNDVPSAEVQRMAQIDRGSEPRVTRMAIVAGREVAFGLARMYQSLMAGSGTEIEVFRDSESARRWLGV